MDISDLKEILRILEAQDITEFELEQDGVKLRVCRSSSAPGPGPGGRDRLDHARPHDGGPGGRPRRRRPPRPSPPRTAPS